MESSRNTLVIIGHHKEELGFGRELKRYMILRGCKGIGFYSVINSFTNNGHGTDEQVNTASDEILREMERSKPEITIDVHTGDGTPKWDGIELKTMFEYEKLRPIKEAENMKEFSSDSGKIFIPLGYSGSRPRLLQQRKFPYIFLEQYLSNPNNPPGVKELEFARKTIEKISALYSNIKSS